MIKTPERLIQKSCVDYLTMLENQGKLTFVRNNSFCGLIQRPNGTSGWVKNNKPGSPDIIVFLDQGKNIQLEIKSSIGKQSTEQKAWENFATKLGHKYYTIRSVDELVKILSSLQ